MTDVDVLHCPDCGHQWDLHSGSLIAGSCLIRSCLCDRQRPIITPAERIAAMRAQLDDSPLVSKAQDRATAQIGGAAWRRVPELSDQRPTGGTIVDTWVNEDGEVGAVTCNFRKRGSLIEVLSARLLLSDCAEVEPTNSYRCARTVRQLLAALGQRQANNGPPLDDMETRWFGWAYALVRASHVPKEAA